MGYIGQAPANKAVKTADIEDSAITAAKIADGTVVAGELASDSVTTAKILNANVTTAKLAADAVDGTKLADDAVESEHMAAGSVDNAHLAGSIATSKIGSGTFADARISESCVTQHVTAFDDTDLRSDIITLALKEAITENRVAYNLPNAMIEQFQDDSKIGTETTGDRNASEYWTTRGTVTTYGTRTQRTVAEVGTSVHHDTAQAKWGTSSIHIPNPSSSGYLTADGDSGTTGSFDFGTTNWTFEFWYRQGDWRGSWRSLFEFQDTGFAGPPPPANRLDLINNTPENQYWLIANSTGTDNRGSAYEGDGTEFIDHPDDTWRHFAVVRESTAITLYYNGSREWTADIGSGDFQDRRYFTR